MFKFVMITFAIIYLSPGGYADPAPIIAAVQSRRTYDVISVASSQEAPVPRLIEIEPNGKQTPFIFIYQSRPALVQQIPTPGVGQQEFTPSEEEHEVSEVIQPSHKVIQKEESVMEVVHTLVAKGEPRLRVALVHNNASGNSTEFCPKAVHCKDSKKYRTIDGQCNNLEHSNWGQSNTPYIRLLPPKYADGVSTLRESVEGGPLPGARELSNKLAIRGEVTFSNVTVIFMQWGQLMAHDITLEAKPAMSAINCCARSPDGTLIGNKECSPIIIPQDDPVFGPFNRTCINLPRVFPAPPLKCKLDDRRQQINRNTHFLDASFVYGSNKEVMNAVRSFKNGELVVTDLYGKEFFPSNSPQKCTLRINPSAPCLLSGDTRVNQQQGLTLLHLLFLREHNRIARILHSLNPGWNDEIIFQETRRIIVAVTQQITYNEWIPLGLGSNRTFLAQHDLLLETYGHSNKYNADINPSVTNEFAAAGFRFHTMIQGFYDLMNSTGQTLRKLQMRTLFNDPSNLYTKGVIDESYYGLTQQESQAFDNIFSDDITDFFNVRPNETVGVDLLAIDIQRGRDHGLPTYNDIREYCGLPRVKNFEDLNNVLLSGAAQKFSQIYKNVDDIDFVIAGQSENSRDIRLFACISAEQFRRTKLGDRYWFENGNMEHSFTLEQLNEIRKVTLASILCQNGDDIRVMQPFAFVTPSEFNTRMDCSLIPKMNLEYWK